MHARFPATEEAGLAEVFRGYGADPGTAATMAAAVSSDPDTALRVHAREELGVDPAELPSPLLRSGLRQLALGAVAVAVAVTFAVSSLIGAHVH